MFHEQLHRTATVMAQIKDFPITVCGADVCEYPLARNLVMLTVAIACEVIINFVASGEKQSFTVTLGDFAIKPFEL